MRARISTSGLKAGWVATSRMRSPFMWTSRPSRIDSRYSLPVLSIDAVSSIGGNAPKIPVAIDERGGFATSGIADMAKKDAMGAGVKGAFQRAFENRGRSRQDRLAVAAIMPLMLGEIEGPADPRPTGKSFSDGAA